MEMKLGRTALVLAAVLSLGSCSVLQFVFGSVFPSSVMLAKAQADLSAQIPANSGTAFNVRVVESGGFGYVVVIGTLAATGPTAFVYDLDLNPKATFTGLATDPGVMVDAGGNIVLGRQLVSPAGLAQAGTLPAGISISSNGNTCGLDGFVVSSAQQANLSILSGSAVLNSTNFIYPWASGAPNPPVTLSSTRSNLEIDAILDNGNGNVTLVVSQQAGNSTKTCYFITTAETNFTAGTIPANILDSSPHRDNIVVDSLGFAKGGILAYDAGASSFVKIDPATGNNQNSLFSGTDPTEAHFGYDPSGGAFYAFDVSSRVLTKYTAWW
ncbi:MAG: hypothetical protein ABSG17_13465 [Spirochaetia bacterium]|jgi:hypothetical protein